MKIEIECPSCEGTRVYVGPWEEKGKGVVCWSCDGTGKQNFTYEPFTGVKKREGITQVCQSASGKHGEPIPYAEFLEGKTPPEVPKEP